MQQYNTRHVNRNSIYATFSQVHKRTTRYLGFIRTRMKPNFINGLFKTAPRKLFRESKCDIIHLKSLQVSSQVNVFKKRKRKERFLFWSLMKTYWHSNCCNNTNDNNDND